MLSTGCGVPAVVVLHTSNFGIVANQLIFLGFKKSVKQVISEKDEAWEGEWLLIIWSE